MKKNILLLMLLTPFFLVNSQELDQAYLESLPDDVREDVLKQVENREELDKPVYRRPSTMVSKAYCSNTKIDRNTKIDQEYNNPYVADYDNKCVPMSERFGTKFFDMMQSSFMPINEPNFDSSYILDFGDTLELQLIGQINSIDEVLVNRDGSINIPDVGKVFVSGMSLDNANEVIKNKISSSYVGTKAFITLTNIRDIQVLITGNAFNPGVYTLNGNSNILHALTMAGGIDEQGSYRQIELIRNSKVIKTFDLYSIFIYGNSQFNLRLRSGDSILVKPFSNLVTLSGAVNRPGIYELKEDETLKDLLEFGNGLSDAADKGNIRIERLVKDEIKYIKVKDLDKLSLVKMNSSDRLNIGSYERKQVEIIGAINTPGIYAISSGESLSSVIKKAGGYKSNAYPFGAILNNKKSLELHEKAVENLYTTFVQKLVTKGDPLFASESLPFALKELRKAETTGRVMAEFDLDIINANPELDTILDDGDEILIPIETQQVYVFGEVNNNGAIRYIPNQSINDYLSRSGGIKENADKNYIYVVHPNGEVNRLSYKRFSFLSNKSNDILIYPGSVIYVPRKVNSQEAAMVASIWAPIVSAMATSITALSVLDRN
ncbi:SLBB domain-containing protein [Gammaproteobacteria bacterium]|nr:SLBB domain-containing protein [Gammaproteobacteria bacterium]